MRQRLGSLLVRLGSALSALGLRLVGLRPSSEAEVLAYLDWRRVHLPPPPDESVGA